MSQTVAIIIPVFNGEAFIADAVRAALAQTVPVDVLVVDDASTDATVARARDAAQGSPRMSLLSQKSNAGPAAARNLALEAVRADWVALLDADDRMAPDRIERLLGEAVSRGWDLAADDLYKIEDWSCMDGARRHWRDDSIGAVEIDFAFFARHNIPAETGHGRELGYLKPLMRTEFLNAKGLRYDATMRLGEDFDLYARALLEGARFGLTDPCGYYAFQRPGSLSRAHAARDLEAQYRADLALERAYSLDMAQRAAMAAHRRHIHEKWAWARLVEAVRARNPLEAAAAFAAPPAVAASLVAKLAEYFGSKRAPAASAAKR